MKEETADDHEGEGNKDRQLFTRSEAKKMNEETLLVMKQETTEDHVVGYSG